MYKERNAAQSLLLKRRRFHMEGFHTEAETSSCLYTRNSGKRCWALRPANLSSVAGTSKPSLFLQAGHSRHTLASVNPLFCLPESAAPHVPSAVQIIGILLCTLIDGREPGGGVACVVKAWTC